MEESPPDRYGVVGFPVAHSRSPFIHGMFARQTAQNMEYRLYEVPPVAFRTEIAQFFQQGGSGLNVTVPHKTAAADFATELTGRAERAGAVNTLAMQNGRLLGDNTDGAGLVRDLLENLRIEVAGKRVLILGAGGATRGLVAPLLEIGLDELVVATAPPSAPATSSRRSAILAGCAAAASATCRCAPSTSSSTPPPPASTATCRRSTRPSSAR